MQVKKKLLDIVRDKVRFKHYSLSTEKTYIHWIKHYIFYHNKKHPIEMAKPEIEAFLTHLAVEKKVSPSTQNQAFSAILFLYKEVLGIDMSSWNISAHSLFDVWMWFAYERSSKHTHKRHRLWV